jgi:hypothetical protein
MSIIDPSKTSRDATHILYCANAIGKSRHEYAMRCIPLSTTTSGTVKILLFGERNWRAQQEKQSIRYVPADRVSPLPEDSAQ